MRSLVVPRTGNSSVLRIEDRPDPHPGPDDVRVSVRAAGVNFADLMMRQGLAPGVFSVPGVLGLEFAGDVESIGANVTGVKIGDRVLGFCRFGGYSEFVVTPASSVIPLPDDWSYAEGAALPLTYATAWAALVRFGNLQPGERVLIHAAAGGVGNAATQIARLQGAGDVYGTASPGKHDAIRGFGVTHPIDYRNSDFATEVRRIAGNKQPLDLVLDAVGGNSFRKSYKLLHPGGRLVMFGVASALPGEKRDIRAVVKMAAATPVFHPMALMTSSRSLIGLDMLVLWKHLGSLDTYLRPLQPWVQADKIRPIVAESFPLDRGADAHRFLEERRNVGKVVLVP